MYLDEYYRDVVSAIACVVKFVLAHTRQMLLLISAVIFYEPHLFWAKANSKKGLHKLPKKDETITFSSQEYIHYKKDSMSQIIMAARMW